MNSDSSREKDAREIVESLSVKRYIIHLDKDKETRERFVVVGNKEYLVGDDLCTCDNFLRQISTPKEESSKTPECKHILALKIARNESKWETYHLSVEEYRQIRPYLWGKKV